MADANEKMREAFRQFYGADFDHKDWNVEAEIWSDAWQAALAEQPAQDEAVAWQCMDSDGDMSFTDKPPTPYERHWSGLMGKRWTPLYTAPPPPAVPDDVAKDAARYRHIRDSVTGWRLVEDFAKEDLDAAIDAEIIPAAPEVPRG